MRGSEKMAKPLDFTGFDANIRPALKKTTRKEVQRNMEEKTVVTTSQATTVAITATTSAEETATTTTECELPTVDTSVATESSAVADSSTAGEAGTANFSIPLERLDTLNKMTRLIGELYTYSYLLNKATGMTEPSLYIDVRMCDDLAEAISLEEFRSVMKEFITATDYVKGIELKKDQLVFTCFQNLQETAGMKTAAASLFNLLSKSITEKTKEKKVNLHKVVVKQPENEKFAFRSWLTKLGWKGAEGKMERNLLYRNLNGNTAFCTEESKIRWEAKHKKGKKGKPTVMGTSEVVSTAEEENEAETTVAETEAVAV